MKRRPYRQKPWTAHDLGPVKCDDPRGSDPWIGYQGPWWWLYYTRDRRIWRRGADDWRGEFAGPTLALGPGVPGEEGIETFSACWQGDKWVALTTGYELSHPAGRETTIYRATSPTLGGDWARHGEVIAQDLPWEQGYETHDGQTGGLKEVSVIHAGKGILAALYNADSKWSDVGRARRVGAARSTDDGRTWWKRPYPVIVPPSVYGYPGITTASHVCLHYSGGVYHAITTWSGPHVPQAEKGLRHWTSADLVHWTPDEGLLMPRGELAALGGPALFEDGGQLWMVYHQKETKEGPQTMRFARVDR